MIVKALVFIALCVAAAILIPLYRRRQLCPHSLLNRILPGRFRDLENYLEDTENTSPCEEFWHFSRGLTGIVSRLRDMWLIVRLLQHQVHAGHISASDARYVYCKALEQAWFSVVAVPEALVCSVWHQLPHACGLFALRSHHEATLRAYTVCSFDGAELQLNQLL